jgi:hypothetical protein
MAKATRKSKRRPLRKTPRRLPRSLLEKMLCDLVGRLDQHLNMVEAIDTANTPNGLHTVIEHRLRTVFGILLDSQLHSLRDIVGFAHIISRDEVAS